ncbi:hypothetical protein EPO14_01815 [Patescibacteria group bacterium]|nr:MAG: hypothetical protein EPO14_01815 [Patescibacteria group bacterium]
MKLFGGAPREKSSSDEEPRDPKKRRTLKLGAAVLVSGLAGSSRESVKQPLGTFAERFNAAEQLHMNGITDFQRTAYKPEISEALAQGINPDLNYPESLGELASRLKDAATHFLGKDAGITATANLKNMDAWRMYLGLPQLHDTFGISDFKPEKSTDDIYYYQIKGFKSGITEEDRRWFKKPEGVTIQRAVERASYDDEMRAQNVGGMYNEDRQNGIMGGYKLTLGKDGGGNYLAYYDKWKLDGTPEGKGGLVGKPFEIYDRIYYDPLTFEVVEPKAISPEALA